MTKHQMTTWTLAALLALSAAACGDEEGDSGMVGGDGDVGGGDGDAGAGKSQTDDALGNEGQPALGRQIDRTGRPAISTALIATFEADASKKDQTKDGYNAAERAQWAGYGSEIQKQLGVLDALDTTCGNQLLAGTGPERYTQLATVLANDQLVVDTSSGTCGVYLGVEAEAVGAVPEGQGGCGGRTPLDDVIERSYSVLSAGQLSGVDDTIESDGVAHDPNRFPWLAGPQE